MRISDFPASKTLQKPPSLFGIVSPNFNRSMIFTSGLRLKKGKNRSFKRRLETCRRSAGESSDQLSPPAHMDDFRSKPSNTSPSKWIPPDPTPMKTEDTSVSPSKLFSTSNNQQQSNETKQEKYTLFYNFRT